MESFRCASCGQDIKPAVVCPHCGAHQPQWAEHLADIERSIAEMKARDAEIAREQRQIAAKMQAALFQRDILAHAGEERIRQATRPRRVLRRRAGRRPPTAATGAPPRVPRQGTPPPGPEDLPPSPPRGRPRWLDADDPEHPPEASSREVQNIPLGLGALLLGVAAVVFAAVATSSMDALARLGVLLVATALMLLAPPVLARRGLTSTAETIAAVGLLLVPLAGYALWAVDRIGGDGSGAAFAGTIFLVTTLVALGYAYGTGLRAPRFATVLAAQPVLPLLAYEWITGPVGWALVLTVVAVLDLTLARSAVVRERPVRRDLPATEPAPPGPSRQRADDDRPESAPEESAEVLGGETTTPGPAATARPVPWLPELTWLLHGVAVALALAYAVTGLLRATTVPPAAAAGTALLLAALVALAGTLVLRRPPLPDVGAAILTLAVIGALGRVASVALPGRSLLLISAVIALTGLAVRAVPESARRGPQIASAVALTVSGLV
ncbi:permease, partial [Micromonospora sp. NPDC005313]